MRMIVGVAAAIALTVFLPGQARAVCAAKKIVGTWTELGKKGPPTLWRFDGEGSIRCTGSCLHAVLGTPVSYEQSSGSLWRIVFTEGSLRVGVCNLTSNGRIMQIGDGWTFQRN